MSGVEEEVASRLSQVESVLASVEVALGRVAARGDRSCSACGAAIGHELVAGDPLATRCAGCVTADDGGPAGSAGDAPPF